MRMHHIGNVSLGAISLPISRADWKGLQGESSATLTDTPWTNYNWIGYTQTVDLSQLHAYMQIFRNNDASHRQSRQGEFPSREHKAKYRVAP